MSDTYQNTLHYPYISIQMSEPWPKLQGLQKSGGWDTQEDWGIHTHTFSEREKSDTHTQKN